MTSSPGEMQVCKKMGIASLSRCLSFRINLETSPWQPVAATKARIGHMAEPRNVPPTSLFPFHILSRSTLGCLPESSLDTVS